MPDQTESFSEPTDTAFIVGAGFNADVAAETPLGIVEYPLLQGLLRECFGLSVLPAGRSVEELFNSALADRDTEPIQKLARVLMKADYFVAPRLTSGTPYADFLRRFPRAPILTFNYDGLLEIVALRLGQWRPEDGFGVEVRTKPLPPDIESELPRQSCREILHLHGSLYVYGQEVEIIPQGMGAFDLLRPRDEPLFIFDPDSATHSFSPFGRLGVQSPPYSYPQERIIAPVPRKAEGRKAQFVKKINQKALRILSEVSRAVVIGYSFNPTDSESYSDLLYALDGSSVVVVVPEAIDLAGC